MGRAAEALATVRTQAHRRHEDPIIVVEGEKCVDALRAVGMVALTSPCGAGKAKCADWEPLRRRDCVLWPDHDEPGRAHMADVAPILAKVAAHVRVIDPARLELPPKGDAADLLEQWAADSVEAKRGALLAIIERAEPLTPAGGLVRLIEDTISGTRQAIPLPWPRVSRLARPLLPATITLLCGAPGCGKSFALLESAYHLHARACPSRCSVLRKPAPMRS